jgi:hypothetical protein
MPLAAVAPKAMSPVTTSPSEQTETETEPKPKTAQAVLVKTAVAKPELAKAATAKPDATKSAVSKSAVAKAAAEPKSETTNTKAPTKVAAERASTRDDRADSAIPRGLTDPDGAADDDPESEAPARTTPANSAPTKPRPARPAPRRDPELDNALAAAEGLRGNHDIQALHAFRLLGEQHPNDPRVLEGWSQAAAATKWWGESLKVAEHWAAVDASMPAQVHLARTQKRLGHMELAIETLKTALTRVPHDREAMNLLQAYGGSPIALR